MIRNLRKITKLSKVTLLLRDDMQKHRTCRKNCSTNPQYKKQTITSLGAKMAPYPCAVYSVDYNWRKMRFCTHEFNNTFVTLGIPSGSLTFMNVTRKYALNKYIICQYDIVQFCFCWTLSVQADARKLWKWRQFLLLLVCILSTSFQTGKVAPCFLNTSLNMRHLLGRYLLWKYLQYRLSSKYDIKLYICKTYAISFSFTAMVKWVIETI
jgi:hypothetical protein